eukprot:TRINITY_DN7959_c0_g1_i3.p1 TRINITY_DN7959_c0_g1~~TRINITY_DN7959_c0_g1_i3.p1  ORF type:complete len:222 (+),score=40.10 TRINITY_DN7959_c0_g1_i3:48-668(+)
MDFVHAVLDAFPEDAVANPEEARVLYSHGGYTILDIRNNNEIDKYGKVPRDPRGGSSVCIPYQNARRWFEDGQVQTELTDNPDFLAEVEDTFPKDALLIVMDFDGQTCAMDALDQLFDAGYENIVGLQGGYRNWFRTWDNKLKRRVMGGEYSEHHWGEGETSCGIHASGAGFENQDAASADFWSSFQFVILEQIATHVTMELECRL